MADLFSRVARSVRAGRQLPVYGGRVRALPLPDRAVHLGDCDESARVPLGSRLAQGRLPFWRHPSYIPRVNEAQMSRCVLRALRPLGHYLSRLFLGAQTMTAQTMTPGTSPARP